MCVRHLLEAAVVVCAACSERAARPPVQPPARNHRPAAAEMLVAAAAGRWRMHAFHEGAAGGLLRPGERGQGGQQQHAAGVATSAHDRARCALTGGRSTSTAAPRAGTTTEACQPPPLLLMQHRLRSAPAWARPPGGRGLRVASSRVSRRDLEPSGGALTGPGSLGKQPRCSGNGLHSEGACGTGGKGARGAAYSRLLQRRFLPLRVSERSPGRRCACPQVKSLYPCHPATPGNGHLWMVTHNVHIL